MTENGDGEVGDDISEISSWADARADTPTIEGNQSDSEDTLSSLSFDEIGISPTTSGGGGGNLEELLDLHQKEIKEMGGDNETVSPSPTNILLPPTNTNQQISIGPNEMFRDGQTLPKINLDLDLPSPTTYKAPTVDYPRSPNQLKLLLGPEYFQSEEEPLGPTPSEDDVSFASSCRAKLDLNIQNGGVRLTKKDNAIDPSELGHQQFLTIKRPSISNSSGPSSLLPIEGSLNDQLEDYLEDFYFPISNESVMQRQKSFRRQVQQHLDSVTTESALNEINKFDRMLSAYDNGVSSTTTLTSPLGPLTFEYVTGGSPESGTYNPESLVDIDAICDTHAPHLMKKDDPTSLLTLDPMSNLSCYDIPKTTIEKLYSVYDSNNFRNLYTLSGELRHILSPVEIEEIIANRVHLEKVIDPTVMAALSWSLTESSLPPYDLSLVQKVNADASKSSSISNGFHSRNTSDGSDDEVSTTSTPNYPKSSRSSSGIDTPDSGQGSTPSFIRSEPQTASFRRRIALSQSLRADIDGIGLKEDGDDTMSSISLSPSPSSGDTRDVEPSRRTSTCWRSLESLDGLEIEDDIDSVSSGGDELFLIRRDSKRFGKSRQGDNEERVVQGLFVESKGNGNGTLRRIKVDLNMASEDIADIDQIRRISNNAKKAPKKRIPLDSNLLRTSSPSDPEDTSQATDLDMTLSEVFHSCLSHDGGSKDEEDHTLRSASSGEDVTMDLDTSDDMADSILGRLDPLVAISPRASSIEFKGTTENKIPERNVSEEFEAERTWKSFSVGQTEIQIDLRAIQPYRRVLSHGGYYDAEKRVAIILFSGCYLPDRSRREYSYLMDHLFLYVLSSLEELIVDDYILVYLHGATPKSSQPSFGWLKRCYQLIDHKLRKNLKGLYLVHPSFWLRTVVALTKPFISSKFSKKVIFVNTLSELCLELPTEHLVIPDPVLQYDFEMKVNALRRHRRLQ